MVVDLTPASEVRVADRDVLEVRAGNRTLWTKPQQPLLVAAAPNYFATDVSAAVGSTDRYEIRRPFYIGFDASELRLSYFNDVATRVTTIAGFDVTIRSVAIEKGDGSAFVPVTFDAGASRSKVVPWMTSDIQSDRVLPAAFGLSKFTRGELYWERLVYDCVPTTGKFPLVMSARPGFTGMAAYRMASASFPAVTADGTGALVGSGKSSVTSLYCGVVLGRPLDAAARAFGGVGDSFFRNNDAEPNTNPASGLTFPLRLFSDVFERAFIDEANNPASISPFLNFAVYGTSAAPYSAATDARRPYYKYLTDMVEEYGQNSFGGSLANFQAACLALWSTFRGEGVLRVWRTKLWPTNTTSSDGFATYQNQNVTATDLPGGNKYQANAWFDAKAADGTLDGVVPWGRTWAPTGYGKFRIFEGNTIKAADGVHPNAGIGIPMMAHELRTIVVPAPSAVPAPIADLAVSAGDTSITALWTTPAGSPSDYLCEISPTGTGSWASVHSYDNVPCYRFDGLTPATSYDVRITPLNRKGAAVSAATATISTKAAPASLLLDTLSLAPIQARSSRRLRAAYAGPVFYLRRLYDGMERAIGFDANDEFDAAFALAWANGRTLITKRSYDQSGNGNDQIAVYTSFAVTEWPILVENGVLQGVNGKAGVKFSSTKFFRSNTGAITTSPANNTRSVVSVVRPAAISNRYIIAGGSTGGYALCLEGSGRPAILKKSVVSILTSSPALPANQLALLSATYDGTNAAIWVDRAARGTAASAQTFVNPGVVTEGVGNAGDGFGAFDGVIPERLVWDGTVLGTTDRQAVENSARAYWGTP